MSEHRADAGESYRRLLHQKRALEEVVSIAEGVEQLNSGLQATALMGRPTAELRAGALRYFAELDETTRIQPTQKLLATLAGLEQRIRDDVELIVELAGESNAWTTLPEEATVRHLDDFRRAAQTAVALRILLRERGAHTDASLLPIDPQQVRERIRQLDAQEKQWRGRIEGQIVTLQEDARTLLASEALPEAMRRMTEQVLQELAENLAHVRAGRSLEQLPHRLEVVELAEETADMPEPVRTPPPVPEPPPPAEPPRGLMARLRYWLNTPWNVRWRDTARRERHKR